MKARRGRTASNWGQVLFAGAPPRLSASGLHAGTRGPARGARRRRVRYAILYLSLVLGAAAGSNASAQSTPESRAETIAELRAALESSAARVDAQQRVIADLRRRLEALERAGRPAAPPSGGQAPAGQTRSEESARPGGAPAGAPPARDEAGRQTAQREPGPGDFEVDPDAAERALERVLVQEGALLLPPGKLEVDPAFRYTRQEREGTALFAGRFTTVDQESDEFETRLDLRLGLPFETQLEFGVPFVHDKRAAFVRVPGRPPVESRRETATGFGDLSLGVAKTVVREEGWRPDVVARVTWNTGTGAEEGGIDLGSGFDEVRGALTALKRQAPLAFTGTLFYEYAFENDGIDPGNEYGVGLGVSLAASPDTSLSLGLQQSFTEETRIDGLGGDIAGSDQTAGVLTVGAASVLGPGVLLSITGGVGLTDDAPDYFVVLSLPVRFDTPTF